MKKVISFIFIALCCSRCYGNAPISMTPSISPAASVMSAGAVARNSATKYQINYKMSLFNFLAKADWVVSNMSGPLATKKIRYGIDSLQHGISLSFFKDRDDDIFYGNTVTFLKGDCDLNSKENFNVEGKEDSDSWTFEDTTSVGILFALNQKKTIKIGPTAGFCMSFKNYKVDNDFSQSIGMLYLPIGVFGEIELGNDWTFNPQFLFNLCLFGNISLSTDKFKSVFFNPDIEIPANKAKSINIKANFSKKISNRVSFHIEPFFSYWDFGKISKKQNFVHTDYDGNPMQETVHCENNVSYSFNRFVGYTQEQRQADINVKASGYECGFILGIKF